MCETGVCQVPDVTSLFYLGSGCVHLELMHNMTDSLSSGRVQGFLFQVVVVHAAESSRDYMI